MYNGLKTRLSMSVDEAEIVTREALAAEGFGILTEIDVAATMLAKLGVERPAYRILGACNPPLANRALDAEPDVGLLLPCNVVVYAHGDETVVAAINPSTMVDMTGNPAIASVAADARARLERVIASVSGG